MRTTKSLLLAALAILSVSCSKENIKETVTSTPEDGLVELTFNALSSEVTRTSIGENVDGKYAVNWSKTDKIAVLDGNTGDIYEFNYVSGDGTQATFSGKVSSEAKEFYALYPYSTGVSCDGAEYIDVPLSNDQTATAAGISSGVMVAYADADMNLKFKNVTAYIKLTIPSGITYVSFAGANKEKLSGKISFAFDGSTVSGVTGDEGREVSLGDGESELAAGTYYLAVAPVALPNGFVVEYMNVDGETTTEQGAKDPELTPGMILNLGERNPFKPVELTRGAAWEWTADKQPWSANGDAILKGTTYQTWTLAGDGKYWGNLDSTKGIQLGSSGSPYKKLSLSSTFGSSYGIGEVVVNASCASKASASISVSVNGKNFLCEESASVALTTTATEYTFKSSELLAGDIVITLSQTTSKAMYLKSIFINPVEKTQLATPTNIVAAVDENIKNKINVSWDAVENAGSYVVSCGDLDPVTTTTPSASFENLAWSTDYKFSVVAKPSAGDAEHLDSDAGESNVVSVGENPAPYIELSADKEEVAADVTTVSFSVKSNVDWAVSTDADWITDYTKSGSKSAEVSLTFTANDTDSDRIATITVKSADGTVSKIFSLEQESAATSALALSYTLNFSKNTSNTSYTTYYDIDVAGIKWVVPGNQSLGASVKIGGKLSSATDRYICSKTSLPDDIKKVIVYYGNKDSQITVNSVSLSIYDTKDDAISDKNAVAKIAGAYKVNESTEFLLGDNVDCTNKFYRVTFNLSSSASSKNYGIVISKVEFYK